MRVRTPATPPKPHLVVRGREDRPVPSAYLEADPVGDFLPTYTGPRDPGLDVVSYEAVIAGDDVVFAGEMAGPIAPTPAVNGLYIIGVDRGRGTPGSPPARPPSGRTSSGTRSSPFTRTAPGCSTTCWSPARSRPSARTASPPACP